MPEEPLALRRPEHLPTQEDYDAIHAAVMETWRGRRFLSEYAKRNRNADTILLLAAIERIEAALRLRQAEPPAPPKIALVEPLRPAKPESAERIAETARPDVPAPALGRIRAAAARLQEMALTLKRTSGDVGAGALQARVAEILQACSAIEAGQGSAPQVPRAQAAAPGPSDRLPAARPQAAPSPLAGAGQTPPRALLAVSPADPPPALAPAATPSPQGPSKPDLRPQLTVPSTAPATPPTAAAAEKAPTTLRSAIARDPLAPILNLTELEKLAVFG